MSKFTCKIPHINALQIKLIHNGYNITNMKEAMQYQSNNKEVALQIDTDNKEFTVVLAENYPIAITDESCVENILGMNQSLKDYHNSIIKDPIAHLVESLSKIITPKNTVTEQSSGECSQELEDLTKIVQSGDWVSFTIKNKQYFGLAILNDVLLYMTPAGDIMGYLTNFTNKTPFVFNSIRRPNKDVFKLDEYDKMELVWENKPKVKKTIQEIEKELGLTPGTLSII